MLDEVDSLLKAVKLHQSTHLLLTTIEDQVDSRFLFLSSPVLLKLELGDDRIQIELRRS